MKRCRRCGRADVPVPVAGIRRSEYFVSRTLTKSNPVSRSRIEAFSAPVLLEAHRVGWSAGAIPCDGSSVGVESLRSQTKCSTGNRQGETPGGGKATTRSSKGANMRHFVIISAALGLALSSLGGCAGNQNPEVRLGYFGNLTHAQALLGVSSDEYAQAVAPTKLVTRVFNAGPSLMEALFAGEIDIGYVGPGPTINAFARTKGQGIRVIAGAAANGVVIVVRPGSGIDTLEDLKGKRIATPQLGNTQDISARHYLMAVLGQNDTNNVIPIENAQQATMMARGQIDAAWAPEPWGARLVADAGAKIIAQEKDLWPEGKFGLTLVVTTPSFLSQHPEIVQKFLAAHRQWTTRLADDPQKYVPDLAEAIEKLTGKRMSEPLLSDALTRVTFLDDPLEGTLQTMGQWAHELNYLREPVNLKGLIDSSVLRSLSTSQPEGPNR
jgi:sulfonate transport system substrate-binding protein